MSVSIREGKSRTVLAMKPLAVIEFKLQRPIANEAGMLEERIGCSVASQIAPGVQFGQIVMALRLERIIGFEKLMQGQPVDRQWSPPDVPYEPIEIGRVLHFSFQPHSFE